jgi:hydroxypyruvate isomerase
LLRPKEKKGARLSANLALLITEVDLRDRFKRAAGAGFTAVEYLCPYVYETGQLAAKISRSKRQKKGWNG